MHLRHSIKVLLLFTFTTLCACTFTYSKPKKTDSKFSVDFVISQFPECGRTCATETLKSNPVNGDEDLFGFCNNPEFIRPVTVCQLARCGSLDSQRLGALIAIYCAPIGGAGQGLISFTPSELECVKNCSSTVLRFTSCSPEDFACQCKDSIIVNYLAPCASQTCPKDDLATYRAIADATCAPFGGFGPYDIDEIQSYLEFTLPDDFPPARIVNSSALVTPTGTRLLLEPTKSSRKGYGKKGGHRKSGKWAKGGN